MGVDEPMTRGSKNKNPRQSMRWWIVCHVSQKLGDFLKGSLYGMVWVQNIAILRQLNQCCSQISRSSHWRQRWSGCVSREEGLSSGGEATCACHCELRILPEYEMFFFRAFYWVLYQYHNVTGARIPRFGCSQSQVQQILIFWIIISVSIQEFVCSVGGSGKSWLGTVVSDYHRR